jgi:PTS system, lactose/cellobiose family IIC component
MSIANTVDEKIVPFAQKIGENKVIQALQGGFMSTMPLTLGVCMIAILVNLPIPAWSTWLVETGIDVQMKAVMKAAMEMSALFLSFMIGYFNAHHRKSSGITGGLISMGAFLALIPHTITVEAGIFDGISFDYLGSSGIFGSMVVAIAISSLFVFLERKGIVVKLPSSVPPMVSQSLSPTFIAIIIFTVVLFVRIGFSFTTYGNLFDFINQTIGSIVLSLGSSIGAGVAFWFLVHLMWFFGIHPNTLISLYIPVLAAVGLANREAFNAGLALPYLSFSAIMAFAQVGGTGNTLGLAIMLPFIAKSERYKALGKLSLGPGIFNINEPLLFGLPMMLNPIFFIPMVTTPLVNCAIGFAAYKIGIFNTVNPTISLPWITPAPITSLIGTGIGAMITAIIVIVVDALIYFPFVAKADKLAYAEEQATQNGEK